MAEPVIQTQDLVKEYMSGDVVVQALRGVSLTIDKGEFVSIIGPSGSGKSTFMGLIGGLDTPTRGTVAIDGIDISNMNERKLTRIRNEKIGFVFQSFNLIPTLNAVENVALPGQFSRLRNGSPSRRAKDLLSELGLGERYDHRPTQLSGGQQQRVAIARALVNNPPLILADEPTGNLDTTSSEAVMNLLRRIQNERETTIVIVTHDMNVAAQADRVVTLVDGQVAGEDAASQGQRAMLEALRQHRRTSEMQAVSEDDLAEPVQRAEA